MRTRSDAGSPWGIRVYFETPEFESMMADALFRVGSGFYKDGQGVDVDLVLLKAYGLEADYVDLPAGVMGRTLFRKDGSAEIQVSRALADEAEGDRLARRRLRTTLAHEGGHVACHRQLFIADTATLSLFDVEADQPEKPAILCREQSLEGRGYQGDWWEFQANQCMACLLLPKRLLVSRVGAVFAEMGVDGFADAQARGLEEDFLRTVADSFDVSWQAALFRLQSLGFVPRPEDFSQGRVAF